ncbi:MAG: hypothetical protein Aurels2KO_50890 [Aureliella sp.]
MHRFLAEARCLLATIAFDNVLEVGCGPGDLAHALFASKSQPKPEYRGIDIGQTQVDIARSRYSDLVFNVASAYKLPATDGSTNLVVACEVLEHLDRPDEALKEMHRVSNSALLVSVPWEPMWRILNMARGKYLRSFGNTPGHVQHFSRNAIVRLVSQHFVVTHVKSPLPWTMLLAHKRN